MRKRKMMWLLGIGGLAAFLALLLALLVVLPRFINLTPIKEKMLANISHAVGGQVACQAVDLAFFPRPQVLVREGSLSVPGKVKGHIESVAIYPRILPLFMADVKVAALRVERPAFSIEILESQQKNKENTKPLSAEIIEQRMASVLDAMASKAPGLAMEVENGTLNILQENQSVLSLQDIDAHIGLPPKSIKVDITSKSNLWDSLSLKGWWGLRNPKGNTRPAVNETYPLVSLEVEGKDVDVDLTREAALTLASNMGVVKNTFRVLQGGKVPRITFKARGNRIADLKKKENIVIAGSMMDGKVFVPGVDLSLEKVSGDVVISEGILQGTNLEARSGNAQGHDAILKLGLTGQDAPFHLDIGVEADLAQLPGFLKRQVKNESFTREIGLVDELQGSGRGRLVLGESTGSIKTRVDVSEFNLSAKYQRIPYSVEIEGGHFSFDEKGIKVEDLNVNLGQSSFSELGARLEWAEDPYLEIGSRDSEIMLDQIYPWVTSFETISARLKDAGTVKGVVALSAMSVHGPLSEPESWQFDVAGKVKGLAVDSSLFSGPIEVTRGAFHAVEDGTKQELTFADAQITMLDASLNVSGVLRDYLAGLNGADLSLEGLMRSESIGWFSSVISMPPVLKPRSPLAVSHGRLTWDRDAVTSFAGDLVVQNGPKVTIDILKDDQGLKIRKMLTQDQDTRAILNLDVTRKALSLEFSGHVTKATLERLFEDEEAAQGWIEGDMVLHIVRDEPMKSKAQGRLEGGDLLLPLTVTGPLEIDRISLEAKDDILRVNSADFIWEDNRMAAKGDVVFSPDGLQLNMDVSTKDLDWRTISQTLHNNSQAQQDEAQGGFWDLPIDGKIRFHTEDFTYERFTWAPFHADIAFERNQIDIAIREADLCGIAFPGTLRITPQDIALDFNPVSREHDLDATFACLSGKKKEMTGDFDLAGDIRGQEKPEALLKALQGNLEFVAKDGRIYRYGLLAKVLAFVNLTEVFRGKVPSFRKEGFAYDSMGAKATIEDGKLVVNEGVVDAPSVEIAYHGHIDFINKELDLKYLVAPLKTLDFVIKKIPLVGRILGGTFLSAPVRVSGDWANPSVTALSPSAVGSGLLGIMERTLKVPVEMIEWRPSGKKPESDSVPSE